MKIFSPVLKGTTTVSGGTTNLSGSFTGSLSGTATTASYVDSSQTDAQQNTRLNAIDAVTGSFTSTSSFGAYTASNDTTNTTQNNRLSTIEAKTGSFATTGSNYFIGTQVITGSVYIANDLIVQGSSSLQNITASAVSIGTNTVILNTDSPAVRFAGISVRDSGSNSAVTSSIWYDSLNNKWIYQNESGSSYSGGMFISGPRNTGSLGDEAGMTNGYIAKGLGGDHIGPSIIFESGSTNIGIGTTNPSSKLEIASSTFQDHLILNRTGVGLMHITATNPRGLAITDGSSQFVTIAQSNGYVGIGITNPSGLLHLAAPTGAGSSTQLIFDRAGGYGAYYVNYAYESTYYANGSTLEFKAGNSLTQLRLASNNAYSAGTIQLMGGNVGIGTTSPSEALDVVGTINVSSAIRSSGEIMIRRNGNELRIGSGDAADYSVFYAGGSERMRITSTGNFDYGGYNVQSSNNSVYRQAFWGPFSIMWRNAEDAYLNSNHTYGSSNTNVASYTSSNGIGRLTMYGGNLEWASYNGSVSAGSAYSLSPRLTVTKAGNVGIGTDSPSYVLDIANNNENTLRLNRNGVSGTGLASQLAFQVTQTNAQSARLALISSEFKSNWGGDLVFYTKPANGTPNDSVTERMRITSTGNTSVSGDFSQNGSMTTYVGYVSTSDGYPSCTENARIYNIGTINGNGGGNSSIIIEVIGSHRGYNNSSYVEYKRYVCWVGDRISSARIDTGGSDSRVGIYNGTDGTGLNGSTASGWNLQLIVNPRCGAAMSYTVKVTHTNLDMTKGDFNYSYFGSYTATVT